MEIHQAPGPPRSSMAVVDGRRVAEFEVVPGRLTGTITRADGTRWTVDRPPSSAEWWVSAADGTPVATLQRTAVIGAHFAVMIGETALRVVPIGGLWRRRWRVVDEQGHGLLEVEQRLMSRLVYDLRIRSGDVPAELPLLVAWLLALRTSAPVPEARRLRRSIHGGG